MEIVSGVKAGETVITAIRTACPTAPRSCRRRTEGRAVSVGALAVRHARAASLIALALVVAGAIAAFTLPSSIYPPLEFPRIVIIAHSGTRRRDDDAHGHPPARTSASGSAGHPARAVAKHPRRVGDLGAVRAVPRTSSWRSSSCRAASPTRRPSSRPTPISPSNVCTPAVFPILILGIDPGRWPRPI